MNSSSIPSGYTSTARVIWSLWWFGPLSSGSIRLWVRKPGNCRISSDSLHFADRKPSISAFPYRFYTVLGQPEYMNVLYKTDSLIVCAPSIVNCTDMWRVVEDIFETQKCVVKTFESFAELRLLYSEHLQNVKLNLVMEYRHIDNILMARDYFSLPSIKLMPSVICIRSFISILWFALL